MSESQDELEVAEVEWTCDIHSEGSLEVRAAAHRSTFTRGSIQVLDECQGLATVSGRNLGPRPIHVFPDGAVNPPDILPGGNFKLDGVEGRVLIRVL